MKPFNALPALVAALALFSPAAAQDKPNWRFNGVLDTKDLCAGVAEQTLELEPRHDTVLYMYQSELYDAAGVVKSDSEAVLNAKVKKLLDARMPELLCNQLNFVPANGNILKLAVARQNDDFIFRVLNDWKPDLNQVDAADGRTVLDYIAWRRDTYRPEQSAYKSYQRMYDDFRKAGAKLRSELQSSGAVASVAQEQARILAGHAAKAQAGDFGAALTLWGAYAGRDKVYGQPLAADPAAAQEWRKRAEAIALSAGNAKNFVNLGRTYTGENDAVAAQWFARAAALDDPEAEFLLGRAHAEGTGVPKDLERALALMTKANGRDPGAGSLLWAGSINSWLGRREQQIAWYRTAWQQGVRFWPVPGYEPPKDPSESPLLAWFRANRVSECGKTSWGDNSCP
jgi:TPR repeat protein